MTKNQKLKLSSRYYNMVSRCRNVGDKDYPIYGARGIKCEFEKVKDYIAWFVSEMKRLGFDSDCSDDVDFVLENFHCDRIDGKKNYSYDNCQLLQRELNEHIQSHEVGQICIKEGVFAPLWIFDRIEGLSNKSTKKRLKCLKYASEFSFKRGERFLNVVWFDFSKPPLKLKSWFFNCPQCGELRKVERILKCECGFHSRSAELIKLKHNRETIRQAIAEVEKMYCGGIQ